MGSLGESIEQQLKLKAHRSSRVDARRSRWATKSDKAPGGDGEQSQRATAPLTSTQLQDAASLDVVQDVLSAFFGANEHVIVQARSDEAARISTCETAIQALTMQVERVNAAAPVQKQAIEDRMVAVSELMDPKQLMEALGELDRAIADSSAAGDHIIRQSEGQQLALHEQYVALLKQQAEVRDQLLATMAQQLTDLQSTCDKELATVEGAHVQAQQAAVAAGLAEMERVCGEAEEAQQAALHAELAGLDARQEQLQHLRTCQSDHYRELRSLLDVDVNAVEQRTEEERARFMIEAERLQLAHQLLLLEAPDQQRTLDSHARTIAQARRMLVALQSQYARSEAAFKKENKELSDDYKQSTQRLRELQARDIAIKASARVKHAEVKRMKEEELSALNADLDLTTKQIITSLTGVVRGGAGSGQRPWAMLERVLTRTCDAWQGIHSDRKQLDRLHAETNSLGTISTTGSTPVSSSMCIAAMH